MKKMHILINTHPTSLDIMDPHLGYEVPLLPQGIVISPHPVELRSRVSPDSRLEPVTKFEDCLASLHKCRPYIVNPEIVSESVVQWLKDEKKASEAYTRFNGREWKLYVDFGVNFREHNNFLTLLNEEAINMNYLKFIENGGQIEAEPLEEICLIAFLNKD